MKKSIFLTALACGAFLTGCCDVPVESAPQPAAPVPVKKKAEKTKVENLSFAVGDEVKAKLRLRVDYRGNKQFSQKLFELISDDLLSEAEFGSFSSYDGVIRLGNEFEVKDKSGEYFRVICKKVRVEMYFNDQLQVSRTLKLAPQPRKLGYDNAVEQYLEPAAREVRKFLANRIAAVNRSKLGVCEISVKISGSRARSSAAFSQEISKAAAALKSLPGVIKYENVAQDVAAGSCTFRVVYVKEKSPQGLRNIFNSKLASLK